MLKKRIKRLLYRGLPMPRMVRPFVRGAYRGGVCFVEGLAFVRKFFWVEPVLRSICEHVGTGLRAERLPYIRGRSRLFIGNQVYLSGRSSFFFMNMDERDAEIHVGDHTFIGDGCAFSAARRITIGCHCLIAACVRVHDNDGHPIDAERRRKGERITLDESKEVVLGNNVWIGAGAVILKGVAIGDNAVIGAGSVVVRDVAANTVVAGNPARVLKTLNADGHA